MSTTLPIKRLSDLLGSMFADADELRRYLVYAGLEEIADEIASRAPKRDAVFCAAQHLTRHNSTDQFLTHLLECSEYAGRRTDIIRAASELGVKLVNPARRPFLETMVSVVSARQALAGLRSPSVSLAAVYVDLLLQSPLEPDFCGKTLGEWLAITHSGQALLILGDPGAGKTELLLHGAAQLARTALGDAEAAIPLLVTATELVVAGSLVAALSRRWREAYDDIDLLLRSPLTRFVLFVDSLDEAPPRKLLELLDAERHALGTRLDTLVLSSRPGFSPSLRSCTRVHLKPWSPEQYERFLDKCATQGTGAIDELRRHFREQHVRELMATPLTAMLCVVATKRYPAALRRRATLFAAVFDDVLQWWPANRSTDAQPHTQVRLQAAPILRDLATVALRERRAGLDRSELVARLRAISGDNWASLLEQIELGLGVLAPLDDSLYRFTDRRLMEYLAARKLIEPDGELLLAAHQPWAQEPTRIAFGLLQAEDPARASQSFVALLTQVHQDVPGLSDGALRALLVAIDVAADEPELAAVVAPQLADAIYHHVIEEFSRWVGDVVARSARRLARIGGPVWNHLEPKLIELLTKEELRRPFHPDTVLPLLTDMNSAVHGLIHRSAEVRLAACIRLRDFIDNFEIQNRLLYMLFDDGASRGKKMAFVAGWALRHAQRVPAFAPILKTLQSFLALNAQQPSCGAAIALHPHEAPTDALVAALSFGAEGGGEIPVQVFEDLLADPSGAESLTRLFPAWSEKLERLNRTRPHPPAPLSVMPYSNTSRSLAFEILAESSLPPGLLDELLTVHENLHGYTESLDLLPSDALYALLDRIRETDYDLCAVAQQKLGNVARKDTKLANYVLHWWDTIDRSKPHLLESFPGRALEPLVVSGDARAIDTYAAWLPKSEAVRGNPVNRHGTKIPRNVLAIPAILAAVRQAIVRTDGPLDGMNLTAAENLSNAWQDDPEILSSLERALTAEHEQWMAAPDCLSRTNFWFLRFWLANCRNITLPASGRTLLKRLFHDVVHHGHHGGEQNDSIPWHRFVAHTIGLAIDSGLEIDLEDDLRYLAGDGERTPCPQLGLHAACAVWSMIPEAERHRLSLFWARIFHHSLEVAQLPPARLSNVISAAPDAWVEQLRRFMSAHSFNALYPTHALLIFENLPAHLQRSTASELLEIANRAPIPWVLRRIDERRPVRLADDIRRIAFETQVI